MGNSLLDAMRLGATTHMKNLTLRDSGTTEKQLNSLDPIVFEVMGYGGTNRALSMTANVAGVGTIRSRGKLWLIGRRSNVEDMILTKPFAHALDAHNMFEADSGISFDILPGYREAHDMRVGLLKVKHKAAELFPALRQRNAPGGQEIVLYSRIKNVVCGGILK